MKYANTRTDLQNNIGSVIDFDLTIGLDTINNTYCGPLFEEKQSIYTLDLNL